jgi:TPR repeat protein
MARIVTKFKYLKPNRKQSAGGYAKYVATRDGVEKIDDSKRFLPVTVQQKKAIENLLKNFPDSKNMLEYQDYVSKQTIGSATEFISRAIEDNAYEIEGRENYAKYIATRPRAERFGSHGLFTDDGVPVQLTKVMDNLNNYKGNIWTVIISLQREDAERLGFNTGERWRDMLRTQTETLSKNFKIPMSNLKWYAAFHNEGHHPHIHMIVYSENPDDGYLSQKGVENIRSAVARDIFADDLYAVYERQTEQRDTLRADSRELIADIVSKINDGSYDNKVVEELLVKLADRLSKTSGKKVYGYLKSDVKDIVDNIVRELSNDENISKLYDLWYDQRENIIRTYTDEMPERIPLVDNKEFKPIKNVVIKEAMNINLIRFNLEMDDDEVFKEPPETLEEDYDIETEYIKAEQGDAVSQYKLGKDIFYGIKSEQNIDEGLEYLISSAEQGYLYAQYLIAKELLSGEYIEQNIDRAIEMLEDLSDRGSTLADYKLGKLYYDGEFVPKDLLSARRYLLSASDDGNRLADYLIGKMYLDKKNYYNAMLYLERSASDGNQYAQYLLGKMLLQNGEVEKAILYLTMASLQGNKYATNLLNHYNSGRSPAIALTSIRLLHHLSKIIRNSLNDKNKDNLQQQVDKKIMQKIEEKKMAQGLH